MRAVGAVILAAGGSTRLGQPKQLLTWDGQTLLTRVVGAALGGGCEPVVVISGAVPLQVANERVEVTENQHWERGLGTSIRCGVQHLLHSRGDALDAVMLLACDQPFVDEQLIRRLISTFEACGKPIAACSYAETLGIPALFHRSCFEALLRLPDASGAKPVITSDPTRVAAVPFPQGAIDIDTPADLAQLQGARAAAGQK